LNTTIHFKVVLAAALAAALPTDANALEKCTLHIVNRDNETISLNVEIARTDMERNHGLIDRKTLASNSGMLFVFQRERILNFWMKNTFIPLSIAYVDRFGVIREIYDMKPLDTSITYMSKNPAMYAIEVNRGWFAGNHIVPGCKVKLHGCLGK